jgi:diguanylate cyclase (GGDEF)-like protein
MNDSNRKNNQNFFDEKSFKGTRKKNFFIFYSLFGIIILIAYYFIQFYIYKNPNMALIDLISVTAIVLNLILYYIHKKLEIAGTGVLIISLFLFIGGIAVGGFLNMGIIWIAVFPFLSLYLKGKLKGIIFIIAFILCVIVLIVLDYFNLNKLIYNKSIFINLLLIFICLATLAFFYEDTTSKSEILIRNQFYFNNLTNLPNRFKMIEDISTNKTYNYHLILINIDDFKRINDFYGSEIGDMTIKEIANRMKKFFNDSRVINMYKLHADEFAIITKIIDDKNELISFLKKIHQDLTMGFIYNNLEIIINITMGVSKNSKDVLANADMALKKAKEIRKDFMIFDESMHIIDEYEYNLTWVKDLTKAIEGDGIIPFFQPIVDNRTGKIHKYECLVRLLKDGFFMTPHFFLDIAKKSKLYSHITKIMILKSFDFFKNRNINFSLNISLEDIVDEDTVEFIYKLLSEYKIAKRVTFELLETNRLEDNDVVSKFIKDLKKKGCSIAIDDFGAGYSNFEYILRMHVDYIKIDSSLIKNLVNDVNSQIITETIVMFTRKLNIKTIAEFVANKKIYDKVKYLKIDYSQGYYLGNPLPNLVK